MKGMTKRLGLILTVALLPAFCLASPVVDALSDVPQNWTAPPYWTPPAVSPGDGDHGGRDALASGRQRLPFVVPVALPFIALPPCRLVDTRGNAPLTGGFLPAATVRSYTLTGVCGLPANAQAVSLNATVVKPLGPGFLTLWPQGGAFPPVSTLNYLGNDVIVNAAVVPLSVSGGISMALGVSGGDVILDTNGYYAPVPSVTSLNTLAGDVTLASGSNVTITPSGNTLTIAAAGGGLTLPYSGTASSTGVLFSINNTGSGYGLFGGSTSGVGVKGLSTSSWGVLGTSTSQAGVQGASTSGTGVLGASTSGDGVYGYTVGSGNYGVWGVAPNGTGVVGTSTSGVGVWGRTAFDSSGGAGVFGTTGYNVVSSGGYFTAGVRGEGRYGVFGVTQDNSGVLGVWNDKSGNQQYAGSLGFGAGYGVFAFGMVGATGTKPFVEPHPTDPSKVIRYVALEGNEAGTYFRGTTRILNGRAVIPVPETFKIVTDEEGLTIQVTPVGAPAMVWVESQGLDQIVLRSEKNVTVHYLVQGFRRAYKDWQVVADGVEYRPHSPDETMPAYLSEEAKKRLIANGTYNADGTVNVTTAERLGWAQTWREEAEAARHK